jgi:WD40 repeat protein
MVSTPLPQYNISLFSINSRGYTLNSFNILLLCSLSIIASLSLDAMKRTLDDTNERRTITFRLDDDSTRTCYLDHVLHSDTIINLIMDFSWQDGQELPLHNVSSDIFECMLDCLADIHETNEFGIIMYLKMLNDTELVELSFMANYLDIKELIAIFQSNFAQHQPIKKEATPTATSSQQNVTPSVAIIPAASDGSEIPSLVHACAQHYAKQDIYHSLPENTKRISTDVSRLCASLMHYDVKASLLHYAPIPTNIINVGRQPVSDEPSVGFSPDGKIIIYGSGNRLVFWDFSNNNKIATFDNYRRRLTICSANNAIAYITKDNTIDLIDLSSLSLLTTITDTDNDNDFEIGAFSISPDLKKIAYINNSIIKIYNLENKTPVAIIPVPEDSYHLCFSPDGKTLAYERYNGVLEEGVITKQENANSIVLWDIELGSRIATLDGHRKKIHELCFSPDGKILASGSKDATVKLWDSTTFECIKIIGIENDCRQHGAVDPGDDCDECHNFHVNAASFSPDGTLLIILHNGGEIKIADLKTNQINAHIKNRKGEESMALNPDREESMALSPDGMRIVSTLGEDGLEVIDLRQFFFVKNILDSELTIEQVKFLAIVVRDAQRYKNVDLSFDPENLATYLSLPDVVKNIVIQFVILPNNGVAPNRTGQSS